MRGMHNIRDGKIREGMPDLAPRSYRVSSQITTNDSWGNSELAIFRMVAVRLEIRLLTASRTTLRCSLTQLWQSSRHLNGICANRERISGIAFVDTASSDFAAACRLLFWDPWPPPSNLLALPFHKSPDATHLILSSLWPVLRRE